MHLSTPRRHQRTASSFLLAAALAALSALPAPLDAQYFGRNKVNYDAFDFRALKTEHFDVYFYPAESLATADAARMAERWFARHATLLGFDAGRAPLIFYADHPDFQQTNVIGGEIGEGTGGVTEGSRERVIMPHTGVYSETDHLLGHELVQVFQYRIAKGTDAGLRSLDGIPLWLIEGMAEYLSLGRDDPNTAMWLRDALRRDDLPTLKQLTTDPEYFPYRYGQAFWAFVGGTYGDEAVGRLFRAALGRGWEQGVRTALSMSSDSLSQAWHAAIRAQYGPTFDGRTAPDSTGRAVVRVRETGDQNVAPAVSPDGRRVAFFSSRDLFGIDLYLADVASGRITRRLTSIASDAHFDALSFINSSGSFSPDGERLAVVTFAEGDHEITVFRIPSGAVDRRITVRGVSAMTDPAWSPDGRRLAFSGHVGGISDLYVYDFEANEARRLTTGREAEVQPAWSPDGRTIAFATDRGPGTDFSTLAFGPMRLATIPVDGSEADIRLLPTFDRGKSINPQYAPDGSILFVSDQDGVSDIYRLDASGSVSRVTNVATGVSGISGLSPAMSVAKDGTIVFSVFTDAGFAIHALDAPSTAVAAGQVGDAGRVAGILPPAEPIIPDGGVARLLADESTGLIAASELERTRVDNRLRLEYVAGPSVGVTFGGGGYGNGLGGGVGLGFRDMLGNHDLGVLVQAQGDIKDIGGAVYYLNQKRRWGWGAQVSHVPYAGLFATAENVLVDDGGGGTVPGVVVVQQLQRVYFSNVDLLAQYPFSRTRRLEMSAGFQHIGFDIELDSQLVVFNQVVDRRRTGAPAGPGINLGRGAMALVGDNSFAAFTSPIAGSRWRLEVGGNAGDLNYQDALIDMRRYFFLRPFTLAFRGLHYGRYGRDAEHELMQPLFLGQSQLVRGYEAGTFGFSECTGDASTGECPEFARLNGSRVAVVNAEFRIPLLGTDRFGLLSFPFLPTEISPFVDAGVAWTQHDSPSLRLDRDTPDRVPVLSYGVTSRMNLFGYAVLEIFWAKPHHRPQKGSVWGFQLIPGW